MQFTVSVKRSGNRNHFMPEQLVYRRDRYWVQPCSLYLLTTATTTTVYFCQFGVSVYVCWGYVNILHWTVCRFSYRPIKQRSVASRQKVLGKSIDTTSREKRSAGEVLIISKRAIMLCHGTPTPDTSRKLSIDKKTLEDMSSHLTEYH